VVTQFYKKRASCFYLFIYTRYFILSLKLLVLWCNECSNELCPYNGVNSEIFHHLFQKIRKIPALESILNQLLEAQVTEQIGADRYERTDESKWKPGNEYCIHLYHRLRAVYHFALGNKMLYLISILYLSSAKRVS